jgi:hypothetical protein
MAESPLTWIGDGRPSDDELYSREGLERQDLVVQRTADEILTSTLFYLDNRTFILE